MNSFLKKHVYVFIIIPIIILLAGCDISSVAGLMGSQDAELLDEIVNEAVRHIKKDTPNRKITVEFSDDTQIYIGSVTLEDYIRSIS